MQLKTFVVRDSAGSLFVVTTTLTAPDAVYKEFARRILHRWDAFEPGFDTGNVDIDVFEASTEHGAVPLVFPEDKGPSTGAE
jgi:hypothetical protein